MLFSVLNLLHSPRNSSIQQANLHLCSPFTRRDLTSSLVEGSLVPRTQDDGIIWCAQGSQTYVVVKVGWQIATTNVFTLLNQAYDLTVSQIQAQGDGLLYPLPYGQIGSVFNLFDAYGLTLNVVNANNHQTTWGVLGAACWALRDFVAVRGPFATLEFTIFDGVNEVAVGTLK